MARFFGFYIVCMISFGVSPAQILTLTTEEIAIRTSRLEHFNGPVQLRRWEIADDTVDEWKQWEMVDNYSFGINRGRMSMIADLQSLHPYFRDKVLELIQKCKQKGIELALVETYRTHAKQTEYRTMGRKYTRTRAGQSKHQYGLAVDVVPIIDSIPQWRNMKLWRKIGPIGERLGLRWGGRWNKLFDPGHFEWTGGTGTYHLAKGNFPPVPQPEKYPCLDEDLRELQRHWKAWEVEQATLARTLRQRQRSTVTASTAKTVLRGGEE
ncbi:MAG: M15 family metallopeptidase [Cyclobacteriaceae bacterium]|nr:M15 family metallopeptidase [Cyclobacteriaceae bacterium]